MPLAALALLLGMLAGAPAAGAVTPAAIKGQVLSWMDPIGYAKVTVYNADTGTAVKSATTDGEGNYLIGGLPPGNIKVKASKAGYLNSWASGASSKATATVYTLAPGQTLEQSWDPELVLYLDLTPEAVITGNVMGFSPWHDDPLGGVTVTAYDAATGKALGSAVTQDVDSGAWGDFRIGMLPAGQVKLRLSAPGWLTMWGNGKYTKATADVYTVAPFSPADVGVLPLYAPASLEGAVMLDDEPVATNVTITVFDAATGKVLRKIVDDDGYFKVDGLPPVVVKVRASCEFCTTAWANWQNPGTFATATAYSLRSGELYSAWSSPDGPFMNVVRTGTIQGQVLGDFDPLGYAKVTVYDAATGVALRSTIADGDGNYVIAKIPVGFAGKDIKVKASKAGWVSSWANGKTSKATADTFHLSGGQTLSQSWDPPVLYLDLSPISYGS